jgi:uncharacterized membrane protein YuzA (DUF378 family)
MSGWRYHAETPLAAIGLVMMLTGLVYASWLIGLAGLWLVVWVCWEDEP